MKLQLISLIKVRICLIFLYLPFHNFSILLIFFLTFIILIHRIYMFRDIYRIFRANLFEKIIFINFIIYNSLRLQSAFLLSRGICFVNYAKLFVIIQIRSMRLKINKQTITFYHANNYYYFNKFFSLIFFSCFSGILYFSVKYFQ